MDEAKTALKHFQIMKDTLAQAKTDYSGLYKLWLIYGILNTAAVLFGYLGTFLIMNSLQLLGQALILLQNLAVPILLIVYYIKIFKRDNCTANKYYLSCLALWGIPAVAMPVFTIILKGGAVLLFSPGILSNEILGKLNSFSFLLNMFLLCLCYIICAFVLNRKWIALIGLAVLFVYLGLDVFADMGSFRIEFAYRAGSYINFSLSSVFYNASIVLGYLAAGLMVKGFHKKGWGTPDED